MTVSGLGLGLVTRLCAELVSGLGLGLEVGLLSRLEVVEPGLGLGLE